MRRPLLIAFLGILALGATARAGDITIGDRVLHVADGFEVQLVAGPPLVERPISISADEQGHLYVTDSGGMSEKAEKQLAAKPHRIRRLTDTNGDGVYDQSTLFADKLMFPEGCLWYDGSLYVAAPPQIWKLTDGDGVAEKREVWFDGKTLTGCGNDLHGPYLGRDGWFYWCKGAFAEQKYTLPNGREMTTRAGHILRARPDGSKLEPVMTGGMDNPVGVAFLSTGERILSCTFFQQPADGKRDGLIHAIYGGVYGKVHDVLHGHVMTGDVMPVLSHQGAAAPCGIIAGSPQLFGGGHEDNVLACYFNLHKVVRHELTPDGATYKTRDTDLLSCDHPDFHPTDVYEDADGSLLIVDTGGWYKVCCPTSVLAKPDVLGAIYRVRKKGAPKLNDPRGLEIRWEELKLGDLANLLADNRPAVRFRATRMLQKSGKPAIHAIASVALSRPDARMAGVWALAGIDHRDARIATAAMIVDALPMVRRAAISAAGLWRDPIALDDLLPLLKSKDLSEVRAAAEAIGRIGDRKSVPALLDACARLPKCEPDASGAPTDAATRVLEHSLIYALIEIGDADSTKKGLENASVSARRAAMVAVDAIPSANPDQKTVATWLGGTHVTLGRTAGWIVTHHPEWAGDLTPHFRHRLAHPPAKEADQAELVNQLARVAGDTHVQTLLIAAIRDRTDPAAQVVALRTTAAAGQKLLISPDWLNAVTAALGDDNAAVRAAAVSTARALPKPKTANPPLVEALRRIGGAKEFPAAERADALLAAGPLPQVSDELLADLSAFALPDQPTMIRSGAVAILAKATFKPEQYAILADLAGKVSPLDLPKLLPAFDRAPTTEALGNKLVASLKSSTGRRGLRADLLKPILARYPQSVRDGAADLLKELNTSAVEQAAHLDKLVADLPSGDISRGQAVFVGKKAGCINCHTIGYNGGRLGPDLTQIGKTRTPRDLLEAIVYPSASFVRGYDPVIVELKDGDKLPGIITTESQDQITLATGPQEARKIDRKEIADIRPSPLSLMPDGMEAALTKEELADVVAFLKMGQK